MHLPRAARRTLSATLLCAAAIAGLAPDAPAGDDPSVRPPDAAVLAAEPPVDDAALRSRAILANANEYTVTTWFPARFGGQAGAHLDFGGTGEAAIRPAAGAALALAASLGTGAYDATVTGAPEPAARATGVRLAASLAQRHAATTPGGWGDEWQSALWAYYAGFAAWLLWDDLSAADREAVRAMVVHEADRFVDYEVPYYRDANGVVRYPGDSKAEENSWNANLLQLATAMLPDHPRERLWMHKNLELMISSFARPSDVQSDRVVNGKPLSEWLDGSNVAEDGTLVNHGFIHPDYMGTVVHNLNAALAYGLAGERTPAAALVGADVIYGALVDLPFASPPFRAPGGTIYRDGSSDLYYPQGNDWGTDRRMHVALLDVQAGALGLDAGASTRAAAWEDLHAGRVLEMQARFADGRTYGATSEDTYAGREQWVAVHAAQAWLTKWLEHAGALRVTNRSFPTTPREAATGTLQVAAPRFLEPGRPAEVSVTFTNTADGAATGLRIELETPPGLTVEPLDAPAGTSIAEGASASARFRVTAAARDHGPVELLARATWRSLGRSRSAETPADTAIAPPPPAGSPYLSELDWLQATNGYGPVIRDTNYVGSPLTVEGRSFARGLWTNAPAAIDYYLGGRCTRLQAAVGVDDYIAAWGATRGSVTFEVWVDGERRFATGTMIGTTPAVDVDVDVTGAQAVRIVSTDAGDGKSYDHADWGDARLTCAAP
jgi:hypothetical protein